MPVMLMVALALALWGAVLLVGVHGLLTTFAAAR